MLIEGMLIEGFDCIEFMLISVLVPRPPADQPDVYIGICIYIYKYYYLIQKC